MISEVPLRTIQCWRPIVPAGSRRGCGARAARAAGVRPGDVLFECVNYSLYAGGVNHHMRFETVGACVAPVGIGQSQRLIEIVRDKKPGGGAR